MELCKTGFWFYTTLVYKIKFYKSKISKIYFKQYINLNINTQTHKYT